MRQNRLEWIQKRMRGKYVEAILSKGFGCQGARKGVISTFSHKFETFPYITFDIILWEGVATKCLGCRVHYFFDVISQRTWSRNKISSNIFSIKSKIMCLYNLYCFLKIQGSIEDKRTRFSNTGSKRVKHLIF